MRYLFLILLVATSSLAEEFPSTKVKGTLNGDEVFECALNPNSESEIFRYRRKDEICRNFPADLESLTGIALSVTLYGLNSISDFQGFSNKYGDNVEQLEWVIWGEYEPKLEDFMNVFHSLPNLKDLKMSGWSKNFSVSGPREFELGQLKKLTLDSNSLLEVFTDYLPHHVLNEISMVLDQTISMEAFANFIDIQEKIEKVSIRGFQPEFTEVFKKLQLKSADFDFNYIKKYDEQKAFIKAFIASQPELIELSLLGPDFYSEHLDDALFTEITKLPLTCFSFPIDSISASAVAQLSNLKTLKHLNVKSNKYDFLSLNTEITKNSLPALESFEFYVAGYSMPDDFYVQAAKNFPNLKTLKINIGAKQTLNFLIKAFPNIENLHVRFGQSNVRITMDESFTDDGFKHDKMKKLDLEFTGNDGYDDPDKFFAIMKSFPNLESFSSNGNFLFTEDFFTKLSGNLGNIRKFSLGSFEVPCNEDFAEGKLNALKSFNSKLDSFTLSFSNVVEHFHQDFRGNSCLFYENGKMVRKLVGTSNGFSFDPMIQNLKNDFQLSCDDIGHVRSVESLTVKGGKKLAFKKK